MIMMILTLIAYLLCGFGFSVFGGEYTEYSVSLDWHATFSGLFRYESEEYVAYCKANDIECSDCTIFAPDFQYKWEDAMNSSEIFPDQFKKIKHLPVDLFLGDGVKKGAPLFTIEDNSDGKKRRFKAVAAYDMRLDSIAQVERSFKSSPFVYRCSDNPQEKGKRDALRAELIKKRLLVEFNGVTFHGPKGRFPAEYDKAVWEHRKKMFFYYSSRLIVGAGFLFAGYSLLLKYMK